MDQNEKLHGLLEKCWHKLIPIWSDNHQLFTKAYCHKCRREWLDIESIDEDEAEEITDKIEAEVNPDYGTWEHAGPLLEKFCALCKKECRETCAYEEALLSICPLTPIAIRNAAIKILEAERETN